MNHSEHLTSLTEQIRAIMPVRLIGSVVSTESQTITAADFPAPIGSLAQISGQGKEGVLAEVIAFANDRTILHSYGDLAGIHRGNRIKLVRTAPFLPVGDELLGRVVNHFCQPIDGKPRPLLSHRARYEQKPPDPVSRPTIDSILETGVRAIDSVLTCGQGQRLGIFSGSGIGKSITLGMMARNSNADVIVIALIGERGREVNDFIHKELQIETQKRCVTVVATSNETAIARVRASQAAMSVAEYFRDQGKNVLFLMDSLTRFAMAQRELGLSAGEHPVARGYTPSVFERLPQLVERAGRSAKGSITAFFTVLIEADDKHDPIGDAVRGLLDGHIWLSRKLSTRGHYPAIDILESISRLMPNIVDSEHILEARNLRRLLGIYADSEDLINIGAYRSGSGSATDEAIAMKPKIDRFLQQDRFERANFVDSREKLRQLFSENNR